MMSQILNSNFKYNNRKGTIVEKLKIICIDISKKSVIKT